MKGWDTRLRHSGLVTAITLGTLAMLPPSASASAIGCGAVSIVVPGAPVLVDIAGKVACALIPGAALTLFGSAIGSASPAVDVGDTPGPTTYTYDGASNRVTLVQTPTTVTTFTYDTTGVLETSEAMPPGVETRYFYDSAGLMVSQIDGPGPDPKRTYTYDFGSTTPRVSEVDASGIVTRFQYDADGRLAQHTDSASMPLVTYTYDAVGQLSMTDAAGVAVRYSYDATGRLESTNQTGPAPDDPGRVTRYTYDPVFNRVAMVDTAGRPITRYHYDPVGRLTVQVVPELSTIMLVTVGVVSTAGGRRLVSRRRGRRLRA